MSLAGESGLPDIHTEVGTAEISYLQGDGNVLLVAPLQWRSLSVLATAVLILLVIIEGF
jgi:hypothetical protein